MQALLSIWAGLRVHPALLGPLSLVLSNAVLAGAAFPSTWPQPYTVKRDNTAQRLQLSTPYYTVEQDLRRGGAISRIHLLHGKAVNLLLDPIATRVRDAQGTDYSDLRDKSPEISHSTDGLTETVRVRSKLLDEQGGQFNGMTVSTRLDYHWGYIRIHKELVISAKPVEILELCPVAATLVPELSSYGYREGTTEQEGAPAFSFGSCRWGKVRPEHPEDAPVNSRFVPRYLMLADPGVEGLEWFAGSDLWQWDLQLSGKRGQGQFSVNRSLGAAGLAISISPFFAGQPGNAGTSAKASVVLTNSCSFDYYLGIPILEGHALKPWFHTSFNRNKGQWVSTDQMRQWANSGIQTIHCHNDGDYYDDGLFWRDGSYPPYPDMDQYDRVIHDAHDSGIRVATYFSNKELHPGTREFQEHGSEWGRKNLKGDLQHNFFRGTNEFGAQMCLRSGWLKFLQFSIDRVLTHHSLDGVYYDWNVALLCCNPLHGGNTDHVAPHWDIDELLQLMEWTRRRVGPGGLVIVHNTTTPMFATENLANDVVANEWGYGKWKGNGPELEELPLEWSLVGARSRGVISYGQLDAGSASRLHRVFALEALVSGVTPWPASPETSVIYPVLKPITNLENCKFLDWRNRAVRLQGGRCAASIYSRPGAAWIVLANLNEKPGQVRVSLDPKALPYPISPPKSAGLLSNPRQTLNLSALMKDGVQVTVPGDSAVLIEVK